MNSIGHFGPGADLFRGKDSRGAVVVSCLWYQLEWRNPSNWAIIEIYHDGDVCSFCDDEATFAGPLPVVLDDIFVRNVLR